MHPIVKLELQRVLRGLNTIVINPLIAELLRTEGRPAEPPTLENKESSTIIKATAFQGKLSAEQYNLTISQAQGGSLSRSRVFLSCPLTRLVFDWTAGSSKVISLEEEGVRAKAKFRGKLTSGTLLPFSSYSLLSRFVSLLKITNPHAEQLHSCNTPFFEFLIRVAP